MKIDFGFLDETYEHHQKLKKMMLHMKGDLPKGDFVNFMQKNSGRVFIVAREEFFKITSGKRYIISKRILTPDEYLERKAAATLLSGPVNIKDHDTLVVDVDDVIEEHIFWMID